MIARALPLLLVATALSGCLTRPSFVPKPQHAFGSFQALREPRADLPVGALWIDRYGPTGDPAAADNLVTMKSLSGVTFDNGFQASVTLGLLKFLDLDPSYSRKMTAHFSDLSIVRVKDMTKLAGPAGQPRIYEGLKAGQITITAIGSVGLDIENRAITQHLPVFGRGTTGLARTFSIDGRDMFIAFEVATLEATARPDRQVRLDGKRAVEWRAGANVVRLEPNGAKNCALSARVKGEHDLFLGDPISLGSEPALLPLRVPMGDGDGGLYAGIKILLQRSGKGCGGTVSTQLIGSRIARRHVTTPAEI